MNSTFFKNFLLALLLFCTSLFANDKDKKKSRTVEGTYQVSSIEKKEGFYLIQFEKYPKDAKIKTISLEVQSLSQDLLSKGLILDITAEVKDQANFLEAEQILVHLIRKQGRTSVWLLSRKEKVVNFEKASFLKMHGTENDYLVL